MEAFALAALIPLKEKVPVALLVDRTTGFVQEIDPTEPTTLRADEALLQSLLAQYVAEREAYHETTLPIAYNKVALWSSGEARDSYVALMPSSNPNSPINRYREDLSVLAEVKSVSQISPGTALVRFDTALTGGDGRKEALGSWIAHIEFEFVEAAMSFEDRITNPLGFQVTSYRRDAERPPAIDLGASQERVEPWAVVK